MKIIKINEKDNTAVALENLEKGEKIGDLTIVQNIPMGHKAALEDIKKGEKVIKYGYPIGSAKEDIKKAAIFIRIILNPTWRESLIIHIAPIIPKYPPLSIKPLWGMYAKTEVWV